MSCDWSCFTPVGFRGGRRQQGVVLIIALIALIAMTLAGLALMRSIDTGLSIAGNLAFKEATTAVADIATDKATTWLQANSSPATNLQKDQPAKAFYADWRIGCDFTGNKTPTVPEDDVVWGTTGTGCHVSAAQVAAADLPSGYSASYVITRMCTCEGTPGANVCTVAGVPNTANVCAGISARLPAHGSALADYRAPTGSEASLIATASPYYRVVTRVVGPRNTTSYIETVVTLK